VHPKLCQARFEEDLAGLNQELCDMRGWTVFQNEYPILDIGFTSPQGRRLRLHAKCEGWNEQPASFTLQDWDGTVLTAVPPSSTNIFNPSMHRLTGLPFICMAGTREYHTHESHVNEKWELIRAKAEYRLGEVVTQIWNGWRKANP